MSKKKKRKQSARGRGLQRYVGWAIAGGVALVLVAGGVFLLTSGGSSSEENETTAATPSPDPRIAGATPAATVQVEADDEGQQVDPRFVPPTLSGTAGQVNEISITNVGEVVHNLRLSGVDRQYETPDDFTSLAVQPGKKQSLLVSIDPPGSYPFRCDFHPQQVGTLILE
jgi:hypothetical protein